MESSHLNSNSIDLLDMGRPRIGITKPHDGGRASYVAMWAAVALAGGQGVALSSGMNWRDADISGLVIGGGTDVFPEHYGENAIENARYDQGRDEMEMYWARRARNSSLPTLAICRGAQIMNVAAGGGLHQFLKNVYDDIDYPSTLIGQAFYRKLIMIEESSTLANIMKRHTARVNSIHKQAIAEVGEGLIVSAREANGVVQAVEDTSRDFYIGVQFHPEFLIYRREIRRIFEGLVEASRNYAEGRQKAASKSRVASFNQQMAKD